MKKVASSASIKENTRRPLMLIQQHFRIKPLEFDLFCGMDVDKRSISVTFVSRKKNLLEGFEVHRRVELDIHIAVEPQHQNE
jgi:hypothetical protein